MTHTPIFITADQLQLPQRAVDAHKGSSGSVAIIGGDTGMVGAVLLAARAALLSGAGRIYAAMLAQDAPVVDMHHPELMLRSVGALPQLKQLNCVAIGPGLGQTPAAQAVLEYWLQQPTTLVLDADALNLIAANPSLAALVTNRALPTIITPHAGEAARLLGTDAARIQAARIASSLQLAQKLSVICVLKGAGTCIALPTGECFVNTTGNPALATGGTGDVLTGVLASLVAQGVAPLAAAKLAVFAHGKAADNLVAGGLGPLGVTASEIAVEVRQVLHDLTQLVD